MKTLFFIVSATALVLLSSCNKTKYGDVTVWQKIGVDYGITVVSINGVSSNITSEVSSTPECGKSGCAVFNQLETGTYNYTASDGEANWSGTLNVTEGCTTLELY